MSDKILKALMQLFAIIANAERLTSQGRNIVEAFLRQQLSLVHVKTYLDFFDEYFKLLQGKADPGKSKKRVSVNSVKVLRICTDINSELEQKQKYIVLIKLIEFAFSSDEEVSDQESEFLSTVANVFNINEEEFESCFSLAGSSNATSIEDVYQLLVINNYGQNKLINAKHIFNETLDGDLCILNIKSAGILFARYFGSNQLTLNGQPLLNDSVYVFSPGSVIRGAKVQPVYYSDVVRSFFEGELRAEINLRANNVEFVFNNGKKGLHTISFSASSGNLIGIMGGSGAGKSTLLNILNSNLSPAAGEVTINGINIHNENKKLEGVIGYVPQDDLLMEDLSVFQNLFYNSKLCFGNLDNKAITEKVNQLMDSLGLAEIKDLKVGDALNTFISGGQRKRLNIALELIRTPAVLFVDEPTSGLSSLDSENVMDLLKQLSITGKLVFVVIHQPSSDIFKLFDKLLILDIGGYPVYYGNPADSLIYFKRKANYADADESECGTCGNINPEQVFSIIESKVLDEFGNPTPVRKVSPEEWNQFYKEYFSDGTDDKIKHNEISDSSFKKPSRFRQIGVFIQRDMLSKLRNTQYLLINFLEAPVLAFILSYFLKYYKEGGNYIFRENSNLVVFIFMSVIVSLFMGLTVSAEEIIRDKKILKREAFLNLSRSSYLFSKISVMFLISAIQTLSFIIIGNSIFGIKDLMFDYWLMLFSISCFANLLGLNISSTFNSAVTIYILIPFLIIPQIILSGALVKFESLNPAVTSQSQVPVIGEIMASRWAYEALAVNQFKNNKYEKIFFEADKQKSNSSYKQNHWYIKMNDKLDSIHKNQYGKNRNNVIALLQNELEKESKIFRSEKNLNFKSEFESTMPNDFDYKKAKNYLDELKTIYNKRYKYSVAIRDSIVNSFSNNRLSSLEANYSNESLDNFVLDKFNFDHTIETDRELIQKYQPVYMDGPSNSFVRAQLYVSQKNVFGNFYSTWVVNLFVIWSMSFVLALALYYNVLKKILGSINYVFERIKR